MIDTHCHFDLMDNPVKYIENNERNRIITIGMTNLPSHFMQGIPHVLKYKYIRLALGLHPLLAENHKEEYELFLKSVDKTSYIGEVGLDFSKEGIGNKELQIYSFEYILDLIKNKNKILSIHSRQSESLVLDMLNQKSIPNAIFHWYTGTLSVLNKIIDSGYYISVNSAMVNTAKGQSIIEKIPLGNILTESDSPFIKGSDISKVINYIAINRNISYAEAEKAIATNFNRLLSLVR